MSYAVHEIYYTIQGEGANTGRPAVFCRFSGCNLWSGREADRDDAVCQFCDTEFVGVDGPGGDVFDSPDALADSVAAQWPGQAAQPLVVCTGGEPLLQVDAELTEAFHDVGFEVAVETNGTQPAVAGLDWICVSPKAGAPLELTSGDELKLVYPQEALPPEDVEHLDFEHLFLQPMDGPDREQNTQKAVDYCLNHPTWRVSLQTHKFIGID